MTAKSPKSKTEKEKTNPNNCEPAVSVPVIKRCTSWPIQLIGDFLAAVHSDDNPSKFSFYLYPNKAAVMLTVSISAANV